MKGEAGERVLGRYRVEHPIGEGGFGCIYLGRQVALDREVAIKASRPGRRDEEGARERFRREALLVAGINHPNVVTYHDFGVDDDGDLVLVMEHLQGCSLLDVLRRGRPMPLADVVRWMAEAAAGLHEAHARGLVHRDVKPSNLFLVAPGTRSERLKVIDFGILLADRQAHPELADLTRSDAFIGTPEYVAPEMMLGRNLDGRADQYALALVTFELLAGRRPFPPADDGGLLIRLSERPEALDFRESGRRVPPGLSRVLWKALSPSPAERYPTIVAFGDALREAAAGFDEDGHGDRTRVARDAASDSTQTLATRDEGLRRDPGEGEATPGPRSQRRRPGWLAAGAIAVGLAAGLATAAGLLVPRTGTDDGGGDGPRAPVAGAATASSGIRESSTPSEATAGPPSTAGSASPVPVPVTAPAVASNPDPRRVADGPRAADERAASPRAARDPSSPSQPARARLSPGEVVPAIAPEPPAAAASRFASPSGPAGQDPAFGTLALNAHPWAEVVVDGRVAGRTPILGFKAPAGSHRIEFRHPTLGTQVVTRDLAAGAREVVTVRFE